MFPITGASRKISMPASAASTKARNCAGTHRASLLGQKTATPRETAATATAWRLTVEKAAGQARIFPTIPPPAASPPNAGTTWVTIINRPAAVKKPDIKEYGM